MAANRTRSLLIGVALGGNLLLQAGVCLSQQKRIYIANDDHTDYLWTANEGAYRSAFLNMLDYYLVQADQTDTLPSDFQGRFNTDGNYWLWTYQKNRSTTEFERLITRIRDGHITVPLQTLVELFGAMPTEAVLRAMYYAGKIERQYNLRFELAVNMENQTLPYGLPSLWAGAGAKYSWKGVCGCATTVTGLDNRGREIYKALGPDGRSVLLKWHSLDNNQSSGGYAEARTPVSAVTFATSNSQFLSRYPFDSVVGMFGKGWDDLATYTDEFISTARLMSSGSQRVIVSNEVDFFRDFTLSAPPDSVRSYSAGFGNEWEGGVASLAEVTASVRRAVEGLRTSEALAAYASIIDPGFMSSRSVSAESAFVNTGLYFEHDFIEPYRLSGTERSAFQRRVARQINNYVNTLRADALALLASNIRNQTAQRFCVFNPLGWVRTDVADIQTSPAGPFRVVDVANGQEVRCQRIVVNGQTYVRILAENVPSVGYRVYEIQSTPTQFNDSVATFSNGNATFETDKYRITLNGRGAISSLVDKRDANREWVQSIGSLLMNDLGSGSGVPTPENVGPVSATILVEASGAPPHRARVTLYRLVDRIDIDNEIPSNFGNATTSYSFGFDLTGHTVRHEEAGAIATAKSIAQGGSYSPSPARYDYFTLNHFVDVSDGQRGMTLSNRDSQFFRLGNSAGSTIDVSVPQVKVIVGGQLGGYGFVNQDGDALFRNRYALRRHGMFNSVEAMRISLEHQNPLVTAPVPLNSGRFPGSTYSLASVSDSNIVLWALKPAEEGINQGVIARVWNLDQISHSFSLGLADFVPSSSFRTTHLETNLTPMVQTSTSILDTLGPQWMQTYRLRGAFSLPTGIGALTPSKPVYVRLHQNFPNPFNPKTEIGFELSGPAHVTLTIFNVLGQAVRTLAERDYDAGTHEVSFDSSNLGSGIYLCRLEAGRSSAIMKMVLIK